MVVLELQTKVLLELEVILVAMEVFQVVVEALELQP
jgi:hypothetical protein